MTERREISLVTAGGSEKLPIILLRSWRQWHVGQAGLSEIPTAGNTGDWLDPRHTEELWLADGLARPKAEVGLQFMVKAGELRCIMPSLSTALNIDNMVYRNRGLRTLPLAHTWTNFAGLQLAQLKVHSFLRHESETQWQTWAPPVNLDLALSAIIPVIAEGPEPLRLGFHLISIPLLTPDQPIEPEHEYGLVLAAGDHVAEVLDQADSPCGCLKVSSRRTAPLSESFRSPAVYQPLIQSEQRNE
jgi:hypothetical protein